LKKSRDQVAKDGVEHQKSAGENRSLEREVRRGLEKGVFREQMKKITCVGTSGKKQWTVERGKTRSNTNERATQNFTKVNWSLRHGNG